MNSDFKMKNWILNLAIKGVDSGLVGPSFIFLMF